MTSQAERTLLITLSSNEVLRATIPEKARITFAKINPQSKGGFEGEALRIYEATSQIACFTNVKSFRDETKIKVQKRIERVEARDEQKDDGQGNRQRKSRRRAESEWVDL